VWNLFWQFGELQKSAKLNTAKFYFIAQCMGNTIAFANIKSTNHSEMIDSPN